jgi:glucose-1-phosphate adenylyltransferase
VSGGHVHRSVLSPRVRVNSYSTVEQSILFENVQIGRRSKIKKAIIDKNVEIPVGTTIGFEPEEDRRRFHVTPQGVVVIPKGMKVG